MTTLDWIAIISLAVAILFFLFALLFLFFFFKARSEKMKLAQIRTKNKKKRKKIVLGKKRAQRKMKKNLLGIFLFLAIGLVSGFGAFYTISYQATNLSDSDKKAIVSGYYYLSEVEKQLDEVGKTADTDKIQTNLETLSSRLSAFALNKADYRINEEGQKIINRYYISMKELGINLSAQSKDFYTNVENLEEFKADLKKVKVNEKSVFKQFKIDEKSLAQQK